MSGAVLPLTLLGKGTAGSNQTENSYAYRHDPPRLPTVTKATGYRCQQAIDEEVQGKHYGGDTSAPAELIQNKLPL